MITNVVRQFNWSPPVISGLFLDGEDYQGLEYWSDKTLEWNPPKKNK